MIKFFRKIRQTMLSQGNIGKYLKYAIGEILLVVIGILIALQINSWNQEKVNRNKETIALNNLILDLEEQSDLLGEYIDEESKFYTIGISILEHFAKHKSFTINDTMLTNLNTLAFRRTFKPINTTFEELVSTGNVGLIRNEALKRNILRKYHELERVSLITTSNNTNLIDGLYNPVLFTQTLFVFNQEYSIGVFDRLFNDFKIRQDDIFNKEILEELYTTSGNQLMTPEKALHLFNVLQFRIQLSSGQVERLKSIRSEIITLIDDIKLELEK